MSDQIALVGEGKSEIRLVDETATRLPGMAIRVMQKMIAAHELQAQCESERLYMSEQAQISMWRDVYKNYHSFTFSALVLFGWQDSPEYAIVTNLGYLLSVWDVVHISTWDREWAEAVQHGQAYIDQYERTLK